LLRPFGLGDHPPFSGPALARAPEQILEAAGWLAGLFALISRFAKLGPDRGHQTSVSRQSKDVVNGVFFAPHHQLLAGKARVGP